MLDADVRRELRSLSKETADAVARHLVVAGRTLDEDPETALAHARAARALAGRVGAVREAAGLAAYAAGEWADALSELRAARRITGSASHLAVLADCERALGRPERALAYGDDPSVPELTQEERVELVIVLSGARRDLGQAEAAVVLLEGPAKRTRPGRPWAARLWYALADALLDAGRADAAREWFVKAADADEGEQTDAADRLLALDGFAFEDTVGDDGPGDEAHEDDGPTAEPPSVDSLRDGAPVEGDGSDHRSDVAAPDESALDTQDGAPGRAGEVGDASHGAAGATDADDVDDIPTAAARGDISDVTPAVAEPEDAEGPGGSDEHREPDAE